MKKTKTIQGCVPSNTDFSSLVIELHQPVPPVLELDTKLLFIEIVNVSMQCAPLCIHLE